ncbi:glycoside hydrolase family 43 protein [Ferruginibacter sp.]
MKNILIILTGWWLMTIAGCHTSAMQKPVVAAATDTNKLRPNQLWYDDKGELINAHGGGIIFSNNTYYWFGEKRGRIASQGVSLYSSADLYHWKNEGVVFSPDYKDTASDISYGCVMERPKVIYNAATHKYVLWFHLELKGKGYSAARAAVAVSDAITGPYKYQHSFRPNGNMSRDMTLFVDDNGNAYQLYSSRENYDLRITQLSADYLTATTEDKMLFSNHREAPAMFRYNNKYYLVTSGCTGWAPNKASVHEAASVWGPWTELPYNPMEGPGADITFGAQSTYVLPIAGKTNRFIFMADKWNPRNLQDSRYTWLPVQFNNNLPVVKWMDEWNLNFYDKHNQ